MNGTIWIRLAGEAVLAAGVIVLVIVAGARFVSPTEPATVSARGMRLGPAVGIVFPASAQTAILFLQSDCRFCRESMSFYRRLTTRDAPAVRIVVAAPAVDTGVRRLLASHAVEPDAVVYVEQGELPVKGTPTVLVADSNGVVTHSWLGRLDATGEAEVERALFRPKGRSQEPPFPGRRPAPVR